MKMIVILNPVPTGLFRSPVTTNAIFVKLLTVINYYKVINITPNKTTDVIVFDCFKCLRKFRNIRNRV